MAKNSGGTTKAGTLSSKSGSRMVTDSEYASLSREAKSHVNFARGLGDGTLDSAIRSARIQVEIFEEQYGTNPGTRIIQDFMGNRISADKQYQHLKDIVSELEKLKKR